MEALKNIVKQADAIEKYLEQFKFRDALAEAMNLARAGNKYLADQAPWKVMKTDLARAQAILGVATQIAAALTVLMDPFMPQVSDKLRVMLGMTAALQWSDLGDEGHLIKVGTPLGQAALLFDKIEDEAMDIQRAKLVKP